MRDYWAEEIAPVLDKPLAKQDEDYWTKEVIPSARERAREIARDIEPPQWLRRPLRAIRERFAPRDKDYWAEEVAPPDREITLPPPDIPEPTPEERYGVIREPTRGERFRRLPRRIGKAFERGAQAVFGFPDEEEERIRRQRFAYEKIPIDEPFAPEELAERKAVRSPGEYAADIAGRLSGIVAQIKILSPIVGAPVATKVGRAVKPLATLHPTLARMITQGLSSAAVWGVRGALQETGRQAIEQEFTPEKIAKEGLIDAPFGLLTGGAGGIARTVKRIMARGGAFGSYAAFEKLMREGGLTKEDMPEILTSVGAGLILGAVKAPTISKILKEQDLGHIGKRNLQLYILERQPKVSKVEAEAIADQINKVYKVAVSNPDIKILQGLSKKVGDFYFKRQFDYPAKALLQTLSKEEKALLATIEKGIFPVPFISMPGEEGAKKLKQIAIDVRRAMERLPVPGLTIKKVTPTPKVTPPLTKVEKEVGMPLAGLPLEKRVAILRRAGQHEAAKKLEEQALPVPERPAAREPLAVEARKFEKAEDFVEERLAPPIPPTPERALAVAPKVPPARVPALEEIHTIDITKDNPLARFFRQKVPLGTTMGNKAAHAKYYAVLFKNSILDILKRNPHVTDVFGRSGTLARIVDTIKPTGVTYAINDLDSQVIAMHEFTKSAPQGVLRGYVTAREDLARLLSQEVGIPVEALYSTSTFKRHLARTPMEQRQDILRRLPRISNEYFRRIRAEITIIDTADKAGKFLFLQRNSVRGVGQGQGFFTGAGQLKGLGLSPLGKPEVEASIKSQAQFLKKANVDITSTDAFDIINRAGAGDFLLIDPPYYRETGYKVTWRPEQTFNLINALDMARQRGAEFTYHDTYNPDLVSLWEEKGYKVYRVKVPSALVEGRVKDEMFIISKAVAPAEKPVTFAEKQIGILRPEAGVWGVAPPERIGQIARLTQEELQKGKKLTERMMLRAANEVYRESLKLGQVVLDLGGVAPYKGQFLAEELSIIPIRYRRATGFPLDVLVESVNEAGYNFESSDQLGYALEALGKLSRPKLADFTDEAAEMMEAADAESQAIQSSIMKVLRLPKVSRQMYAEMREEVVGKLKKRIARQKETVLKRERRSKLIKSIKKRLKIGRKLKWGYQDRIEALADGLITKKVTAKERESLAAFGEWVEAQQAEGVTIFGRSPFIKDLGKQYLHEMDEASLRELNNTIQSTIHLGRLKNKLKVIQKGRDIDKAAQGMAGEIRRGKEPPGVSPVVTGERPIPGLIGKLADIGPELIRLERILIQFGGGRDSQTYKALFEAFNKPYTDYVLGNVRATRKHTEYFNRTHQGKVLQQETTPEPIREGLALNHAQMKMVYLWSLDKQARAHLLQGNMFTKADLAAIQKKLTPQDKADISYVLDSGRKYYDEVNLVHRQIYGVDMPRRGFWFHLFTDSTANMGSEGISAIVDKPQFYLQALDKGFIKPRKGGMSPLILDFWGNFARQTDMLEKYKAMALVEQDLRALLKHPDIKKAMVETYRTGAKWHKDLNEWFGDVIGYPPYLRQDAISRTMHLLRMRAITSVLWGNVMVMARMTTSLPVGVRYTKNIDALQYMSEFLAHPGKTVEIIHAKDPIQAERHVGGERDVAELLEAGRQRFGTKAIAGKATLLEKGGKLMFFADRQTSGMVWWVNYRDYINKRGVIAGPNRATAPITDPVELERKAVDNAQYMVRTTQPAWRIIDLPKLFRSKDELTRTMTALQNFPNQMINMIVKDDFTAWKQGRISRLQLLGALLATLVTTPLLFGLSRRWRWPTRREVLSDIIVGPIGYVPGIGRTLQSTLESKITGSRTWGGGYQPLPFIFVEAWQKAVTSRRWTTRLRHAAHMSALIAGVPFAAPRRFIQGAVDWIQGDTRDLRRLFVSEWTLRRPEAKKPKSKIDFRPAKRRP